MASNQTSVTNPPRAPRPRGRRGSLIDWRDPEKNNDVLDWRRRAHEFGLVPVDTWNDEGESRSAGVVDGTERLLHDEEPEAFEDQQQSKRPSVKSSAPTRWRKRRRPACLRSRSISFAPT